MFTNKSGCTVYERTVRNRSPAFVRHETGAVYWEEKRSQENGADRTPQNEVFVCISKMSAEYVPKIGDKIVCRIISDESPPDNSFTVMSARDFCYGSPAVQHWEVTAK